MENNREVEEMARVFRERPEVLELMKAFKRVPENRKAEALAVVLAIPENAEREEQ